MPKGPWDKYAPDAPVASTHKSGPWDKYAPDTPDYSDNSKKEGLYEMRDSKGVIQKVPYSKVEDAFKTGLRFQNPAGVRQYTKDREHEGPSALSRFAEAEYGAIGNAAKGAVQLLDPRATEEEKQQGLTRPVDVLMRYPERLIRPNLQEADKAGDSSLPVNERIGSGIASVLPLAGPWMWNTAKQMMEQAGSGNYAGASGTAVGNAMVAEAPKAIGKVAKAAVKAAPAAIRSTAEALTKTGPGELKKLAQETQQKNTQAAQAHLEKVQPAVEDTRGKEIGHESEERAANEKVAAEHKANTERIKGENQKTIEKHKKELADAQEHNARVTAKHEAETKRAREENDAAEHALELRRTSEAKLEEDTAAYYAKESAVKARVKGAENSAWKKWRDKAKGVEVDADPIVETIDKYGTNSPEIKRMLSQLIPPPEDAPSQSRFYQERQALIDKQGWNNPDPNHPLDYEHLSPVKQQDIDAMAKRLGMEPDPIDFNPQKGDKVSLENVHRALSIINKNIRNGRYEGIVQGEMTQVAKKLNQQLRTGSESVDALEDLENASVATREYHEAFGIVRNKPKTGDVVREKEANPDAFKEMEEEERLKAASKHDPSLVEDYEKVKAQREQLKKLHPEDQLRESLQQVPTLSPDSLRPEPPPPAYTRRDAEGKLYQLKDGQWVAADETGIKHQLTPEPPELTHTVQGADGQLYKLQNGKWELVPQPRPQNLAHPTPESVQLERPKREEHPDRPEDQTITPQDIQQQRGESIEKFANRLREMGVRRALYTAATGLTGALTAAFLGHPLLGAAADAGAGTAVLVGSHVLANLLEKPEVVDWLSKVSPKDVAQWEKLPPEQKALFTHDMSALAQAAQAKKIFVSPALSAFIAGTAADQNQPKSPEQIKKEADELQKKNSPEPISYVNNPLYPAVQHALSAMDKFSKNYSQTATGPNGHKIGSNDGHSWFDVQTGQQV